MPNKPPSDLELFHQFLTEQLESGLGGLSPEQSVDAFRAHQRDVERFREDIRPALERSRRGESQPLDIEDIKARGKIRLAEKGISD